MGGRVGRVPRVEEGAVECKGCRQAIVDDQYRLVAEWPFCLACFDRLQNRRETKPEPAPTPAAEPPRPARSESINIQAAPPKAESPLACAACGTAMTAADKAQMGQLGICAKCRNELIVRPFQKVIEREAAQDEARAEEAQEARAAATPIPREEIFTPGMPGNKRCAQCSRRLLEPGGYRMVEGQPYCPNCSREVLAKVEARAAAAPAASARGTGPAGAACDACERPLVQAEAAQIEGFSLCRPCVAVDVEAALSVARARHKARLRKLRDDLAG